MRPGQHTLNCSKYRQILILQHSLELFDLLIGPKVGGVADDLGGLRPLLNSPRGLQGRIGIGVTSAQSLGPGIHYFDRFQCVLWIRPKRI